jgi:hypothetical protein
VHTGKGTNGTLAIELDTMGDDWVAIYSFNGEALRTNTYTGSLTIAGVAFGTKMPADVEFDNFKLSVWSPPPANNFENWMAGYSVGSLTNMTDDFDGDMMNNLVEYGLGGDPAVSDASTILPISEMNAAEGIFTYYLQSASGCR